MFGSSLSFPVWPLQGLSNKKDKKLLVWNKGKIIPGFDPAVWRMDDYGHYIKFSEYGNRNSVFGWEFDHIFPGALGGSNDIINLRPLRATFNARLGGALSGVFSRN